MSAHAVPESVNKTVAAARREQWIIFSNLLVALTVGLLATWSTPMMLGILYIDIWLLANPHIAATYTRAGTIASSRTYWILIVIGPVLIAAGLTIVALAYETAGLFALYFAAQAFHVSRQSYGIARRYDRRLRAPLRSLPYWLIYLFPAWGYLHRSALAPGSFLESPMWLPPVSLDVVNAAEIVAIGGMLGWLLSLLYCSCKKSVNQNFNAFVLSHLLISFVGYVWIADITIGWLVVNVWHNVQYLVFVYRQPRPEAESGKSAVDAHRSDRTPGLPVPGSIKTPLAFFATCSVGGAALYIAANSVGSSLIWLGFPTVLIAHFILNFHHYLMDGFLWKRRRAVAQPQSQSPTIFR